MLKAKQNNIKTTPKINPTEQNKSYYYVTPRVINKATQLSKNKTSQILKQRLNQKQESIS